MHNIFQDTYALTLDIDWAPDFIIDAVAEKLRAHRIKATWFITHDSPAVRRLMAEKDLFECGLHPNFYPGSSHGGSEKEVMEFITALVPGSRVMRMHALYQHSRLFYMIKRDFDVDIDVSLFLMGTPNIQPHVFYAGQGKELVRIPYFWEDDLESYKPHRNWDFHDLAVHVPGLKVFDFHPVYIYLNIDTMEKYEDMKTLGRLNELPKETVDRYIHQGAGAGTFFQSFVEHFADGRGELLHMEEIKDKYLASLPERHPSLVHAQEAR